MHPAIHVVTEGKRGCGYRKPGGMYLRLDGPGRGCGLLPIELTVCPCCGHGIKPSRSPAWINDLAAFIDLSGQTCKAPDDLHLTCPMMMVNRGLMIWVGMKYYPTPGDFNKEAVTMGISRRITSIPQDFEVGKDWVFLAHQRAIVKNLKIGEEPTFSPGIFKLFQPDRIEIVVTGEETDKQIESYLKRGLTPVLVEREGTQQTFTGDDLQ